MSRNQTATAKMLFISVALVAFFGGAPLGALAANHEPAAGAGTPAPNPWGQALIEGVNEAASETYKVPGEGGGRDTSLATTLGNIINTMIGALGTAAVFLMIYAGFTWMTAGGDEGKIEKSKTIIKQVIVGLIVLSLAYGIVSYVVSIITKASGQPPKPAGSTSATTDRPAGR